MLLLTRKAEEGKQLPESSQRLTEQILSKLTLSIRGMQLGKIRSLPISTSL